MRMDTRRLAWLLTPALAALTGCPTAGTALLSGTWSGSTDCVIGLSINGGNPLETNVMRDASVTFDDQGRPTNLSLAAAAFAAAQTLDINLVGETRTYQATTTVNNVTYTSNYVVTVREANFTSDSVHVVYDYTLEITATNFSQIGEGTATFDATITGDNTIEYTQSQTTDLVQETSILTLNETVLVDCTGTLTREQ